MDEFRHRSFAQVCRAEANVSLSASNNETSLEREVRRERRRFKVVHERGELQEKSNAPDAMLERMYEPFNPLSSQSFRKSVSTVFDFHLQPFTEKDYMRF